MRLWRMRPDLRSPVGDTGPWRMPWACRSPYAAAANPEAVPVRRWHDPSALGGMGGSYRKAAMLATGFDLGLVIANSGTGIVDVQL